MQTLTNITHKTKVLNKNHNIFMHHESLQKHQFHLIIIYLFPTIQTKNCKKIILITNF